MKHVCATLDEYQKGCYLQGHYLYHSGNQRIVPLHCNRYSCSLHGWKKKARLQKAIETELKTYKMIRFWTFTLSSASFNNPETHYHVLALAWRKFITEVRRNNVFTKHEKQFQYLKVVDPHKNGYLHFHAVFDRFIHQAKILAFWRAAIVWASKNAEVSGGCYVKMIPNAKIASRYIAKYVTKAASDILFRLNYYSKSRDIILFPKYKKDQNWHHATDYYHLSFLVETSTPLLVPPVRIVTDEEQKICLFAENETRKVQEDGFYGSGI